MLSQPFFAATSKNGILVSSLWGRNLSQLSGHFAMTGLFLLISGKAKAGGGFAAVPYLHTFHAKPPPNNSCATFAQQMRNKCTTNPTEPAKFA